MDQPFTINRTEREMLYNLMQKVHLQEMSTGGYRIKVRSEKITFLEAEVLTQLKARLHHSMP